MYNPKAFEEAAFNLYLQGALDFEQICERIIESNFVYDTTDFQAMLDEAQKKFEEKIRWQQQRKSKKQKLKLK